jgi:2-keto-3-deoxy-galactonokinase
MKSHNFLAGILLGAVLATGCAAVAQETPMVDIGDRHGNLRDAQEHIVEAWRAISRAQEANDARLGGHAARAKELLGQANEELRLAADVANDHRRW